MGYRLSFFRKVAAIAGIDLVVIHSESKHSSGRIGVGNQVHVGFPTIIVPYTEAHLGSYTFRWQFAFWKVRKWKPDIVILNGISGILSNWLVGLWARLTGIRLMMWTCGWEAQRKDSTAYRVKRAIIRHYYRLPSRMLVYSSKAKEYMVSLGVAPTQIRICHNGIETDHMLAEEAIIRNRAKKLRESRVQNDRPLFLFVGAIIPEKRVELLLDAFSPFARQYKGELWLIGDGKSLDELKRRTACRGLSGIRFFGRITKDVDEYFAAADYFVLPGTGGLALNQAMFWNVPCICGEGDGTEEDLVYDGETGFRFKAGSVESLRATILRAMTTPSEARAIMGDKSRRLILERGNVNRMVNMFEKELFSVD